MAITPKNIPKHFLKIKLLIFVAALAPIIAPSMPKSATGIAVFQSIFLFFAFMIVATIDVGMKNSKLVPCATCCSTPINKIRASISIVPPPHC